MNSLNKLVSEIIKKKGENSKSSRLSLDNKGILEDYYKATGNNPKNFNKFKSFLSTLSEAESFSGKKQSSNKSSAHGLYHYLDESVMTSDNRIKNLLSRYNVNKKLGDRILKYFNSKVQDRPEDIQSIMVLSDLMESPTAPYKAWNNGEVSDKNLYYKGHHTEDKGAISSKEQVYKNWDNAVTRLSKLNSNTQNEKYYNPVEGRTKADHDTMYSNEYVLGGQFFNPQQNDEGELTEYNTGGSHQSNPHGGISLGMGANGMENKVQEGEASFKSEDGPYIFSDNIYLNGSIKK